MTTASAAVLLFLVIDPVGNVPIFASLLAGMETGRARRIVMRELVIALAILIVFLLAGESLLRVLHISEPALSISGGIILFLVALRMIFTDVRDMFRGDLEGEPFIVPLAVPFIAGPSAMATLLLLMAREPARWTDWLWALVCAWLGSGVILIWAGSFSRILGKRGLSAVQRLMGMLLTTVAVQMSLSGLRQFFQQAAL
jgi:multiple antibiotic resistance protein